DFIDDVTRRAGLNGFVARFAALTPSVGQQFAQIGIGYERAAQFLFSAAEEALGLAALHRQDDLLDAVIGQLLGRLDRGANGILGHFEAVNRARADALRFVKGRSEHADAFALVAPDDTGDLGRADIQRRDKAAADRRHGRAIGTLAVHADAKTIPHLS